MKNDYEIRGETVAIIIKSKKYGTRETLISIGKLEIAKKFCGTWCIHLEKRTNSFYVVGNSRKKTFCLHRWITNATAGFEVDHRDHDTLNNTDINLRVVTGAENKQNRKSAQVNSKSGIRGVSWLKTSNKWRVQVRINKASKYIGLFDDIKDAEIAAIEARKTYLPFAQ